MLVQSPGSVAGRFLFVPCLQPCPSAAGSQGLRCCKEGSFCQYCAPTPPHPGPARAVCTAARAGLASSLRTLHALCFGYPPFAKSVGVTGPTGEAPPAGNHCSQVPQRHPVEGDLQGKSPRGRWDTTVSTSSRPFALWPCKLQQLA